jgi:hypothetical protein
VYSEYPTQEALEGCGDFKIGGLVIYTVKYADDLVLLAKEEAVLQGVIERLMEIGRCYGMEMNVEKTTMMRSSKQLFRIQMMIDKNNWRMWIT